MWSPDIKVIQPNQNERGQTGPTFALYYGMMMTVQKFLISLLILGAWNAQASIALRGKNFSSIQAQEESQSLDLTNRKFVKEQRQLISKEDLEKFIPLNANNQNDAELMKRQLISKASKSLMKSAVFQRSLLGRTAKKVKKSTKVEMAVKGQGTASQKETDHKVDFQIQALKQKAHLTYQGFVDSKLEYLADEGSLNLAIEEQLSQNSKIALSHKSLNNESRQMVNFQVNW